jgi:hypothetical protein
VTFLTRTLLLAASGLMGFFTNACGGWTTPSSAGAGGEIGGGNAPAGGSGNGGGCFGDATGAGGMPGSGETEGADGTTCGVAPVNPNATTQARRLLCFLYSQSENHVISGQQETSWNNPENDPNWILRTTGKCPAILGGDYLYPSGTTSRARAYWEAGGITLLRYHMGAPPSSDTYQNSLGTADIESVLTEGSSANVSFRSKLDYAARELQTLQDADVAVLWAPFHEAQPDGWFWWSKGSGTQFVQLWTYMFDYFTNTKGLNNLIWLLPFSGSPHASFYPGRDYVDLAGPDTYSSDEPFTSLFAATRTIVGTTLPIPLHENGRIPDPVNMFSNGAAPWVFFNTWAGYQISHNSVAHVQSVYSNPYTVARDGVPNLR